MKANTKTATNNTIDNETVTIDASAYAMAQTHNDIKHATLIVSLLANAFVFIGWVTLQVTSVYDYEVAAFLFTR